VPVNPATRNISATLPKRASVIGKTEENSKKAVLFCKKEPKNSCFTGL
jgi:hypothetical protein